MTDFATEKWVAIGEIAYIWANFLSFQWLYYIAYDSKIQT